MKGIERENMIKQTVIAIGLSLSATTAAFGQEPIIQDHYKEVINQKPYHVEVCKDVNMSGDKSGDMLKGAIIGGIIGNNITKDLPDGGTAGAIIGGLLGHQNSTANDGTKLVCNKMTRYKESMETIYSHSTITFNYDGRTYTVRFQK